MGITGAVFESAGKRTIHWIPGVYSRRNTVPGGSGAPGHNLVIMGQSIGGKPHTLIPLGDVTEAKELLTGGPLLDAIAHAFNGSNDFVPQEVYACRVNKGTRAKIALTNSSEEVIEVYTSDYGVHCNQVKIWVQAGTNAGKKIRVDYKGNEVIEDNIQRNVFGLKYIGGEAASTVTISTTDISIDTPGDEDATLELTWESFPTIGAILQALEDTGKFVTEVYGDDNFSCSNLDTVATISIKESEPTKFNANVYEFCRILATMQYIGEVKYVKTDGAVLPDNDDGYKYFAGGTSGAYTITEWAEALGYLEEEDVQCIATPSTDDSVMTLIADHVAAMSQTEKKKERQAILGMLTDTTVDAGVSKAKALNNEYVSLLIDKATASNPLTGAIETISPAMLACKLAGMEASMGMATPLTNKTVKVVGFGIKRKTADLNTMIKGGVLPMGINEDGNFVIIRAITTNQDENLGLNERSCVREALFMDRDLRKAYSRRIGSSIEPSVDEIKATLERKAVQWYDAGLITRADDGKLVFDIKVKFIGDKTYLTYSKYLRAPNNFVFITSNNMIYGQEG